VSREEVSHVGNQQTRQEKGKMLREKDSGGGWGNGFSAWVTQGGCLSRFRWLGGGGRSKLFEKERMKTNEQQTLQD